MHAKRPVMSATSDVKPMLPLRGGLDKTGSLTGIDEVKPET